MISESWWPIDLEFQPLRNQKITTVMLASLIETCKLNGVNPQAYFTDLLTRLVNGWPQKRIDELMPWHWAPERPP